MNLVRGRIASTNKISSTAAVEARPRLIFLLASDVRRQYFNRERLPVRSEAPRYEHPIMPSPGEGREPDNWRPGLIQGPVRAIYNEDDRTVFEVGYHERSAVPSGPHVGARQSNTPFRLAWYHPTIDYRDEDENRRS
ncbi:hypothetical protein K4K61_002881 [Colletotrichum sp. SAR11_59]|nr:hypothetical protein K4K61_002881 [Colletotrichum sp. SAR11_59]